MYPGSGCTVLLKEQATFIKARIALVWMVCLSSFYTSLDNDQLWEYINVHVMNMCLVRRSSQMKEFWCPYHSES